MQARSACTTRCRRCGAVEWVALLAAEVNDNVEIVRRVYEAWSHGDIPGPVELFDENVEYVNPVGAIEPGTRTGVTEFASAGQNLLDSWEFWRAEPLETKAVGDQCGGAGSVPRAGSWQWRRGRRS